MVVVPVSGVLDTLIVPLRWLIGFTGFCRGSQGLEPREESASDQRRTRGSPLEHNRYFALRCLACISLLRVKIMAQVKVLPCSAYDADVLAATLRAGKAEQATTTWLCYALLSRCPVSHRQGEGGRSSENTVTGCPNRTSLRRGVNPSLSATRTEAVLSGWIMAVK